LNFASLWWKDICGLGKTIGFDGDWFVRLVSRKVGNGRMIVFGSISSNSKGFVVY
jgi:hypothetical protein